MTTNAGLDGTQEPRTGGAGSEGPGGEFGAAGLRAVADRFELRADAIAITYQDPGLRWKATAWYRQRVWDLRAAADLLDPPTEAPR